MIKAIADLHLSLSTPDKDMSVFGSVWLNYIEKIEINWKRSVNESDIVLLPGDISWAMKLEEMKLDLQFLASLPGKKILIKGNHDYWSATSLSKVKKSLPENCFFLGKDYFFIEDKNVAVVGTRLWDSPSITISPLIFQSNFIQKREENLIRDKKILEREKNKLICALENIPKEIETIIVMTHYPPIGTDYKENEITCILEHYNVKHCVFGHLHNVKKEVRKCFFVRGINYHLVSADCIDFVPVNIC